MRRRPRRTTGRGTVTYRVRRPTYGGSGVKLNFLKKIGKKALTEIATRAPDLIRKGAKLTGNAKLQRLAESDIAQSLAQAAQRKWGRTG